MDFIHLHVHSVYSTLDGVAKVEQLAAKAAEYKMPALALTDHYNLYGVVPFYKACKDAGIKPILGVEAAVDLSPHKTRRNARHITLWVMNEVGWHNLLRLVSESNRSHNFYYRPRFPIELLAKYNEGLIAGSACVGGIIAAPLVDPKFHNNFAAAFDDAVRLKSIFGDRFYAEIMDVTEERENNVARRIVEVAESASIPIITTNDVHYVERDDADLHQLAMALAMRKNKDEMPLGDHAPDFWFKPAELIPEPESVYYADPEMRKYFERGKDRTLEIAERCNFELGIGEHHYPKYVPLWGEADPDADPAELLRKRVYQGAYIRYGDNLSKEVKERIEKELDVIISQHFAPYFLLVSDILQYARNKGYQVGPGRGSSAGSMVAYCLQITHLDPLRFGLLFERFLNVERKNPPDIDMDFPDDARQNIIARLQECYGEEYVAGISTYVFEKPRSAWRDIARYFRLSRALTDQVAELLPDDEPEFDLDEIKAAVDPDTGRPVYDELLHLLEEHPELEPYLRLTGKLTGTMRHVSAHAAGVVVSPKPIVEYGPYAHMSDDDSSKLPYIQYNMDAVSDLGLVKIDFLGLKALRTIYQAVELIRKTDPEGKFFDIFVVPLDDPLTLDVFNRADTLGVFQFASQGFRHLLNSVTIRSIDDLLPLVALYRPGPIQQLDTYVKRMNGLEEPRYLHPMLEPILKPTYGIIVFQEQIMEIVHQLGGLSLGQAEILMKAMAKKKEQLMEERKPAFFEGCARNGIPPETVQQLWDLILHFAKYGFNKSHSAAYTMVAYWMAYLKAHYPYQYYTALLTTALSQDHDILVRLIAEASYKGIPILAPSVLYSGDDFTLHKSEDGQLHLRFPLSIIKGIGHKTLMNLVPLQEELRGLPFIDVLTRLRSARVGTAIINTLIKVGAFDEYGYTRASMLAVNERLFKTPRDELEKLLADPREFDLRELREFEYEHLGLWIYSKSYAPLLPYMSAAPLPTELMKYDGAKVRLVGRVDREHDFTTSKGTRMAFVTLSSFWGVYDLTYFNYASAPVEVGDYVQVEGHVDSYKGRYGIIVDNIKKLEC